MEVLEKQPNYDLNNKHIKLSIMNVMETDVVAGLLYYIVVFSVIFFPEIVYLDACPHLLH